MSGGGIGGRQQQAQGPGNLWTGQSYTPFQQPRGQMMYHQGGGFGGGRPSWPGFGYGGMPGRYGGMAGYQPYGMPGMMFGGFSGRNNPYGPGSYSSPGAMPYGGGSGMYGGGTYNYNLGAQQMAGIPYQQMARSRFSMPYRPVEPPQQTPPGGGMMGRAMQGMYNQNRNQQVMVPGVGMMDWGDYWG